jgi:hypothetical protein
VVFWLPMPRRVMTFSPPVTPDPNAGRDARREILEAGHPLPLERFAGERGQGDGHLLGAFLPLLGGDDELFDGVGRGAGCPGLREAGPAKARPARAEADSKKARARQPIVSPYVCGGNPGLSALASRRYVRKT